MCKNKHKNSISCMQIVCLHVWCQVEMTNKELTLTLNVLFVQLWGKHHYMLCLQVKPQDTCYTGGHNCQQGIINDIRDSFNHSMLSQHIIRENSIIACTENSEKLKETENFFVENTENCTGKIILNGDEKAQCTIWWAYRCWSFPNWLVVKAFSLLGFFNLDYIKNIFPKSFVWK